MSTPGIKEGLLLLKQPNFAKLFIAYLVTYFGTAMTPIALAFGVLELTGSASQSGIVIAASTAGQITVLLISGTLADRTSRKKVLVSADTIAFFTQLAMGMLFITGQATVPLLAGLMLATGAAYGFHQPAFTGFIPQIVKREELQAANALLGAARNGSFTIGAAMAGVLVATVGAGITILIDAISFGISALLILSLKPSAQAEAEDTSFLAGLIEGWTEFTAHKWLWTIVLQFSILVAALDALHGLLGPAIARELLGGAVSWGILAASMGAGTIAGGLLAMKLRVQRPMLVATLMVLFWALVPLSMLPPLELWVITICFFVAGLTGEIFAVLWYTTLQTQVPPNLLSRVSAYDHLGSIGIAPLGIVAGGFLYDWLGREITMLICAACVIVPTLLVLCIREVRTLRATHQLPASTESDKG